MAKWCGKIGYVVEKETAPDYWEKIIKERTYYGDLISIKRSTQNSENSDNDNIKINSRLSIISDPFAKQNFDTMKYATINGVKWKIESIDFAYPRMNVDLGGVYNVIRGQENKT